MLLQTAPEVYAEFAVEFLKVKVKGKDNKEVEIATHWKLKPVYVDYLGTGAHDAGRGKKHVTVRLQLDGPGKTAPTTVLDREYDFGFLPIGTSKVPIDVDGDYVPFPERTKAGDFADLYPVKITATVTETEPGPDWARVLNDALSDAKARAAVVDSVSDAVVKKIDEKLGVPVKQPAADGAAKGK